MISLEGVEGGEGGTETVDSASQKRYERSRPEAVSIRVPSGLAETDQVMD